MCKRKKDMVKIRGSRGLRSRLTQEGRLHGRIGSKNRNKHDQKLID